MASFKPNKPENFDGKRDRLVVESWLYQVQQYFHLLQVVTPELNLNDQTKIAFASTLLRGTSSNWWFMKVQSGQAPNTFDAFMVALRTEFIPGDGVRRSRDKLRRLTQKASVSAYLNEFRNTVLGIPGISQDEMLDRFCSGLKPQVKLEVLKSNPQNIEDASRIALSVDSALYGSGMFQGWGGQSSGIGGSGPQPMELGNVEKPHYRRRSFKGNRGGSKADEQKLKDRRNGACYVCHKVGCRASNHKENPKKKFTPNNTQVTTDDSDSESEN